VREAKKGNGRLTLLREGASQSRQTHKRRRLHVLNDLLERLEFRRVRLRASEVALVFRKIVATVMRDESLFCRSFARQRQPIISDQQS
jgi:hypothetical protein